MFSTFRGSFKGFFYNYNTNFVVYCIVSNHITHYQIVSCNFSGFFFYGRKCHFKISSVLWWQVLDFWTYAVLFFPNMLDNLILYMKIKLMFLVLHFKFGVHLTEYKGKYKNKNVIIFNVCWETGRSVRARLKEHKAFLNAASYWHTGVKERRKIKNEYLQIGSIWSHTYLNNCLVFLKVINGLTTG